MQDLVLHHRYRDATALDVSDNHNSGTALHTGAGTGPVADSLTFNGRDSRVVVPPGPSLAHLGDVVAYAEIWVDVTAVGGRLNVMEGHLSFSFSITAEGGLAFGIVDANDEWNGRDFAAGAVAPDTWHRIAAAHDGLDCIRVVLDDAVVGEVAGIPGPVRGVGPLGLAIGNWPDEDRYGFAGAIREVQLYRHGPLAARVAHKGAEGLEFRSPLTSTGEPLDAGPLVSYLCGLTPQQRQALAEAIDDIGRAATFWLGRSSRGDVRQAQINASALNGLFEQVARGTPYTGPTTGGDLTPDDAAETSARLKQAVAGLPMHFEEIVDLARRAGVLDPQTDTSSAADAWSRLTT